MGMDWSLREGYSWAEDKEHCEEYGRMLQADPSKGKHLYTGIKYSIYQKFHCLVSDRAKKRGLPQLGTLGTV